MNAPPDTANFHWIIKNQNKNEILELLKDKKVGLNETDKNCNSLLHLIFQNENLTEKDVVQLLVAFIDQVEDLNVKNNEELTVLHLAVAKRWKEAVEFLISHNADILTCDKKGNTVTHFFIGDESKKFFELLELEDRSSELEKIEEESCTFIEWLIGKGFDFVRWKNEQGKSALHLSIEYNLQHVFLFLMNFISIPLMTNECDNALLYLFFEHNDDYTREYRDDVMRKKWCSYTSRHAGSIVKHLLDRKAHHVSFEIKDRAILELTVPKERNTSKIEHNSKKSSRDIIIGKEEFVIIINMLVYHLLKCCPKNDLATTTFVELMSYPESMSYLWDRKQDYFYKILKTLICKGANVNGDNEKRPSPLYIAILGNNQRLVDFLTSYGANFNNITGSNRNLYHALAQFKYYGYHHTENKTQETLFELIKSKGCCDVNFRNSNHDTPLHVASRDQNLAIVRKLVESGAEVNCKNIFGQTPLYYALNSRHTFVSFQDRKELTFLLMKAGADISIEDNMGRLAYDYGRNELVTVLFFWKEMETLRNTMIDSRISLDDFTKMHVSKRCLYINNEKFKNFIDSPKLRQELPHYANDVLLIYYRTVEWKKLLEPAKEAWLELTDIALPDVCLDKIFAFLKSEDFFKIIGNRKNV